MGSSIRGKSKQVLPAEVGPASVQPPDSTVRNVERRRASRFQLRLPVVTHWTNDVGQMRYGGGFTKDICLRGVFVVCSEPPPKGTIIAVAVAVPSVRSGSQELQMQTVGTVVRVEQGGSTIGYAIDCEFGDIENLVK